MCRRLQPRAFLLSAGEWTAAPRYSPIDLRPDLAARARYAGDQARQTQRIALSANYAGRWLMKTVATDWAAPRRVRWYGVE